MVTLPFHPEYEKQALRISGLLNPNAHILEQLIILWIIKIAKFGWDSSPPAAKICSGAFAVPYVPGTCADSTPSGKPNFASGSGFRSKASASPRCAASATLRCIAVPVVTPSARRPQYADALFEPRWRLAPRWLRACLSCCLLQKWGACSPFWLACWGWAAQVLAAYHSSGRCIGGSKDESWLYSVVLVYFVLLQKQLFVGLHFLLLPLVLLELLV